MSDESVASTAYPRLEDTSPTLPRVVGVAVAQALGAVPASTCGMCFGAGWVSDGYNTVSCTCLTGVQRDEARFRAKEAAAAPPPLDLPPSLQAEIDLFRENPEAWHEEWRRKHEFKVSLLAEVERLRFLHAAPLNDWLESKDFYDLMQTYRHAPSERQDKVIIAFEAVKTHLRSLHVAPEGARLRELARSEAAQNHWAGVAQSEPAALTGHEGAFDTCPHPDCVLARSAHAPVVAEGALRALEEQWNQRSARQYEDAKALGNMTGLSMSSEVGNCASELAALLPARPDAPTQET